MGDSLEDRIAATAAGQHGLISLGQARKMGVTHDAVRHRVDVGRWVLAAPGVYRMAGSPVIWRQRLLAAVLACGDGACASHRSAAALYGVPGFAEGVVDLTVPRKCNLSVRADRILQRRVLPIGHRRSVDGIPVTTLPRTLFDLAGVLPRARVERALDTCLARRWVALPALQRVLADLATRGRAGTAVMRELLEARGGGYVPPASALEARFLNIMRAAGLAEPQRELELGDDSSPIGRVEFVYASQRLLVEVDGDWYHTSLTDQRSDRARDRRFVAEGWRVLRLDRNLLVNDPEEVVRLVRNALRLAA